MPAFKDLLKLFFKGGVVGVANIIPGVSGGTMAVVLGIYKNLIEAIGNFFTARDKRREYLTLLGVVGLGAIAMVFALSWVMDYLLSDYPQYTYLFFIGLIGGSVPSIYAAHEDMRVTVSSVLSFLAGLGLILSFAALFPDVQGSKDINFDYEASASALAMLFLGGVFSGGSMIVPGISGSFVLVLLGQYRVVIKALKEFDLLLIVVLGAGVACGIWAFAKLIDFLLKRYPRETFFFILGLVIASLYPIFPGFPEGGGPTFLAILLTLGGAALAYSLGEKK